MRQQECQLNTCFFNPLVINTIIHKRKVFHDMDKLKLSEKFHLRYFALHIEELSQEALTVADQLSVMSIRRII